ncbi:hypothetical protein HYT02_04195 [Candidatus Gottesmanbacteria bacterium]|nr:hypothetical protein [Candidatus Gottesmanbacteria bacterium]
MAVNLQTLINASSMKEETKKQILDNIDNLNSETKAQLTQKMWIAYGELFRIRLRAAYDTLLAEVKDGKRQFNKNDFVEVETKLYNDFARLLESASTEEEVEEVRKQLQGYKVEPFKQDPVDPNFQPRVDPSTPIDRPQDLMKKAE